MIPVLAGHAIWRTAVGVHRHVLPAQRGRVVQGSRVHAGRESFRPAVLSSAAAGGCGVLHVRPRHTRRVVACHRNSRTISGSRSSSSRSLCCLASCWPWSAYCLWLYQHRCVAHPSPLSPAVKACDTTCALWQVLDELDGSEANYLAWQWKVRTRSRSTLNGCFPRPQSRLTVCARPQVMATLCGVVAAIIMVPVAVVLLYGVSINSTLSSHHAKLLKLKCVVHVDAVGGTGGGEHCWVWY